MVNYNSSGIAIIGIMLTFTLLCIIGMMFFEKYILIKKNEKILGRIILLCILINVLIFVFLVLTFSKIKFNKGPIGPKGIRGRKGRQGYSNGLNQCVTKDKTLGELKYENDKQKQIKIQTPILESN